MILRRAVVAASVAWSGSLHAAIIAATVFVMMVIWVRPQPTTLYGIDAGCYARVAAEMAARPVAQWSDVRLGGQPFYEHPPGFMFIEALAFRMWGVSTATAVFLARLLSTLTTCLVVLQAHRVAGPRAMLGTLIALPALSSFLFESQNPMLETPLCAALLLAMHGAWELPRNFSWGCLLFALGSATAFWVKGPPALAAWAYLLWVSFRQRLVVKRATAAALVAMVAITLSVVWFEWSRSRQGLPPFFGIYWQHQVMPSLLKGRHNPIASPWYYLPIVWRWQTLGVVCAIPALALAWFSRRRVPEVAPLTEMALVWGAVLFVGFSVARQKYQWYLHPMTPCFAWLGGAIAICWPQTPMRSSMRRLGVAGLAGLTFVYCLMLRVWPETLHKHHRDLEALHATQMPEFVSGEPRNVAYCGSNMWREDHVARFLWQANLLPCVAEAPYRFDGKELSRVTTQ